LLLSVHSCLLPQKIISLDDAETPWHFIEFIKDGCIPWIMRRPLDAVKAYLERHKDRRAAKKGLLESERILAEKEAQLGQSKRELAATDETIRTTSAEIGGLEAKIKALNDELQVAKTKQEALNEQRTKELAVVEDGANQVEVAQDGVAKAKANLDRKTKEEHAKLIEDHPGPEKKMAKIELVERDASMTTIVHALGDLHGWAPGLINYLTAHGLAKIEISGIKVYKLNSKGAMSVDEVAMGLLFPDLIEYLKSQEGMDDEQKIMEWPHAGLLGQPGKEVNLESHHTAVSAEWTGKNEMFIQVGDVFDRADHSELAAEILRQLVIQAPAHVHILVGNHEEFLLLNHKESWLLNERKWTYDSDRGGNTRMLPMLYEETPEEELLDITWERYKSAAATLYLTQYFAKEALDTSLAKPLRFLNSERHENFKERILAGTWEGYQAALELHELILESASESPLTYPGAIAGLGVGDTWFMHAEPNGLKAFVESADEAALIPLRNPRRIGGRDFLVLEMDLAGFDARKNRFDSNCSELFWARDASTGFEGLSSRFSSQTTSVLRVMPGVRNIVHGHSPVPLNMSENKPHTYIARRLGQPVSPTTGSIRVYNIDEGMTPVYGVFESNKEKMKYIPVGLRVPDHLLEHHQSGDIIDEADLWTLNDSHLELEHPPFTTHPKLTLGEVPEQYKVKGPGQITLGELTQDDPAIEHTSADDFMKDPTKFSWLKMDEPENITNPLEGSTPAPDGLFRVQHDTYMTMTLGEHLLTMLELEAEPPNGQQPFASKSTEGYLKGLRTEFKRQTPEFKRWGSIFDAYHTGSVFIHLRSTQTGMVLNIRGINMTEVPVKIKLYNHLGKADGSVPSTSIREGEILVHPGTCSLTNFDLIKPESHVDIDIDLGDGSRTLARDIVFATSHVKPGGDPNLTSIPFLEHKYKEYQIQGEFNEGDLPVLLRHHHQKYIKNAKMTMQPTEIPKQGKVPEDETGHAETTDGQEQKPSRPESDPEKNVESSPAEGGGMNSTKKAPKENPQEKSESRDEGERDLVSNATKKLRAGITSRIEPTGTNKND